MAVESIEVGKKYCTRSGAKVTVQFVGARRAFLREEDGSEWSQSLSGAKAEWSEINPLPAGVEERRTGEGFIFTDADGDTLEVAPVYGLRDGTLWVYQEKSSVNIPAATLRAMLDRLETGN